MGVGGFSEDPFTLNVTGAEKEKSNGKRGENRKIEPDRDPGGVYDRIFQDVDPVSERENEGERLQYGRESFYRYEEAAEKYHRETEKVRKGLGFEDFADGNSDEKSQIG